MGIKYPDTPAKWRDAYLAALRAAGHRVSWRRAVVHDEHGYLLTCSLCGGELQLAERWSSTVRGRPAMTLFGNIKRCPQSRRRR
jgi:hypothetical protein